MDFKFIILVYFTRLFQYEATYLYTCERNLFCNPFLTRSTHRLQTKNHLTSPSALYNREYTFFRFLTTSQIIQICVTFLRVRADK